MMKEIFQRIWNMALPYQDKRDDKGHAQITLGFAETLIALENGNEDIIVPAIILHDIGWSQLSKQTISILFSKNSTKDELFSIRIQHQNESVRLARDILADIFYPPDLSTEILEIISQHDTREGFISKNEGLVRDADKLWRFSKVGFEADVRRSNSSIDTRCKKLENELNNPKYMYSASARRIASEELELRKESK